MDNPYSTLGIGKSATASEIKSAYRRLAKKYHPDSNANDKAAQEKFADISAAYELLGDKEKRQQFDNGEIDAKGNPNYQGFNPFGGGATYGAQRGAGGFTGTVPPGAEDIFSEIFSGLRGGGARARGPVRGRDVSFEVLVSFNEAAKGATRRIAMPNGKQLDVTIPAGVADGQQIRLKGQGQPSPGGGPAGDALVTVKVAAHPLFQREGRNLRLELPVTLYEAVLGAKIRVPTLDGSVGLKVPPNSSSGRILRLKGKGIAGKKGQTPGDLLVTLRIVLPDRSDAGLKALMEDWGKNNAYDPRGSLFRNI